MYLRIVLAVIVFSMAAFPQAAAPPEAALDTAYQVGYMSYLNQRDSVINLTNTGWSGAQLAAGTSASVTGSICVNAYAFTPDEQMIACCSCPVTPNGLKALSGQRDLIYNPLTPVVPSSIVVKLLATVPQGGSCNNSAANVQTLPLAGGMVAWGTSTHSQVAPAVGQTQGAGPYYQTEFQYVASRLSDAGTGLNIGEKARLGQLCNFILANGTGFGICRSCQLGGLGANFQ